MKILATYLRIIKHYTECSDEILKNFLKKTGAAIVLVSILYEIFRKFARGTKQRNHYLKTWDTTPLHEAAKNGHVTVYQKFQPISKVIYTKYSKQFK